MGAALNTYRPLVRGQQAQPAQARQAPTQAPRQVQASQAPQGYRQQGGVYVPGHQPQHAPQAQGPQTPYQSRQAHRAAYQTPPQGAQSFAGQDGNFYQSWQNGGMPPQNMGYQAGYAPQGAPQGYVQQGQAYRGQAPALQAAYAQGAHQHLPAHAQPIQHFASHADERSFDQNGTFNPQAYGGDGWRNGIQSALVDPRQKMFDKAGQINAHDNKDALTQIRHMLQYANKEARFARMNRQAQQVMTEERRQVLAAAVQDPEGFAILGQELLLPIKEICDYEALFRKVYRVRPLAQGELFRIAKDVRSTAWVIGQDGQGIEARLYGRYVTPSEFKIGSFPTVDIEDIYQMNYDVLERAQSTARQEIELEEDKRGWALMDTAARTTNTVTSYSSLGVAAFEDVRFQVERHRLVVEKFLINRAELSDIVKTMSTQVDPVTERELILAGYIGSFLNAVIVTSSGTGVEQVIPSGSFYAVTGPEYFGEMGIRVELFSEPFNMFSQFRFVKGWAYGEIIGYVIPSPKAVAVGEK